MHRIIHEPEYYTQSAEHMAHLLDQGEALAYDWERTEAEHAGRHPAQD